jgi:hypothetical protein
MLRYAMLCCQSHSTIYANESQSNAGKSGLAVRVMVVPSSPHDAPAMAAVDTDAVVWTN